MRLKSTMLFSSLLLVLTTYNKSSYSQEDGCGSYLEGGRPLRMLLPALPSTVIESPAINELQKIANDAKVIFKIPVVMHVIRKTDGSRGINENLLYQGMNELNNNLKEVNMLFFIKRIDTIDNTDYYDSFSVHREAILPRYHVNNCLNVYIAGSLGPMAPVLTSPITQHYIQLNANWIRTHPTTWMHEFGHYFGLRHTFGPANRNLSGKELVDGSNCDTDGDKICDTPADPKLDEDDEEGNDILQPAYTIENCVYTGNLRDRNGQVYNPDLRNFMSYATDCRNHYTIAQKKKIFQTYLKYRFYLDLDTTAITLYRKDINLPEGGASPKDIRLTGDVNGDKLTDIISINEHGVYVTLRLPNGNFSESMFALGFLTMRVARDAKLYPRILGDVSGDGLDDLITFGASDVWVALGQSNGLFSSPIKTLQQFTYSYGWRDEKHTRLLRDVNGDGKMDIIGFFDNNVFVALAKSDGSGMFEPPVNANQIFTYNNGWRKEKHLIFLSDVNRDNKADIIAIGNDSTYVAFGNAFGQFEKVVLTTDLFTFSSGWRIDNHLRTLADVNGDGIPDIVGFWDDKVLVCFGNSSGTFQKPFKASDFFTKATNWNQTNSQRFFADFNGDGKDDLVGINESFVFVALASINGFSKPRVILRPYNEQSHRTLNRFSFFSTNLNGDNKEDMLGFTGTSVYYLFGKNL